MSYSQQGQSPKPFDLFLDSNPKQIQCLFEHYEFMSELRAQNPRLGGYIKNSIHLLEKALEFVTVPPRQLDGDARKYKYPLLVVEIVECENQAIIGCFFPEKSSTSNPLLWKLFSPLLNPHQQILPLLGSYTQRILKFFLKLKPNQTLFYIYQNPQILQGLVTHSYDKSLEFLLQALVNVESAKESPSEKRCAIRVQIVRSVIAEYMANPKEEKGSNLGDFLIDVVERSHLIADGRKVLDEIMVPAFLTWLFKNIEYQSVMKVLKALTNYYCMSILNTQQPDNPSNKSNLLILQQQPFIRILASSILQIFQPNSPPPSFSYSLYRITQIICHSICIRSPLILQSLIDSQFFISTLETFFKTDSNIFHSLVEKSIAHIFYSQKTVYEGYKEYLLGEMDIVGRIVGRVKGLEYKEFMRESWAGYVISIVKMCLKERGSKRVHEVMQQEGVQRVVGVVKVYDERVKKELGSYEVQEQIKGQSEYLMTKVVRRLEDGMVTQTVRKTEAEEGERQSRVPLSELLAMTTLSQSIEEVPDNAGKIERKLVESIQVSDQSLEFVDQLTGSGEAKEVSKENQQHDRCEPYSSEHPISTQKESPISISEVVEQPLTTNYSRPAPLPLALPPLSTPKKQTSIHPSSPRLHLNHPSPPSTSFSQYMKLASKQAQQTIRLRRSSTQRQLTPVSKGLSPTTHLLKKSWTNSSVQKNPMRTSNVDSKDLNIKIKLSKSPPRPSESKRWRQIESKDIPLLSFLGIIKTDEGK